MKAQNKENPPQADGNRRLFGRRRTHRLKPRQAQLMETLLPRLELELPRAGVIDRAALFGRVAPLWLEVGFGGGEHLVAQAAAHPQIDFIGCEPFENGVAKCLCAIEDAALTNVRLHVGDARDIMEHLPDKCVERVFVLFPDPWPKKRHYKRRFIQPETLDQLARLMPPGTELRIASDIGSYLAWTLTHLQRHAAFEWLAECAQDWRTRPADWPATRYEAKAVKEGRRPAYLRFGRQP